jgi:hypothetical protein
MLDKDFDEARRRYAAAGWLATGSVIETSMLDKALEVLNQVERRDPDLRLPERLKPFFGEPAAGSRPKRYNQYIALQYRAVAALATAPVIGRLAAALAQTSEIRIFNTALVVKMPGIGSAYDIVGWHCDKAYWPTCSSARMLTAWIPLQDTTAESGTLCVLDGSHRWLKSHAFRDLAEQRSFLNDNEAALASRVRDAGMRFDPVPIELKRGQISFHHMLTLHGSGVNRTDKPRFAISVHLQDQANHYIAASDEAGIPLSYVHDDYVLRSADGLPDYADPDICPVVWRDTHLTRGEIRHRQTDDPSFTAA